MKFELRHDFDVPVAELERVLFHDGLSAILAERMTTILEIEPMSVSSEGNRMSRRVRYLPVPLIKSVGVKKVEPEWMEWLEESTYDFSTHTGTFRNIPARHRIAHVMRNQGTLELRPTSRGGSQEVLRGELTINVFLVGRLAEKVIHYNAVKILQDQARVVAEVLRNNEL